MTFLKPQKPRASIVRYFKISWKFYTALTLIAVLPWSSNLPVLTLVPSTVEREQWVSPGRWVRVWGDSHWENKTLEWGQCQSGHVVGETVMQLTGNNDKTRKKCFHLAPGSEVSGNFLVGQNLKTLVPGPCVIRLRTCLSLYILTSCTCAQCPDRRHLVAQKLGM